MRLFSFKSFRDIPIAHKLYFTVGIMAVLITLELFTLYFATGMLSAVRAYVGGEGLWSKAQKDAVYQLMKYGISHDNADYDEFEKYMEVPRGDAKARAELMKAQPDMAIARQGFIEGRNHADDIDGMIMLFRRFNGISYIRKAIIIWGEAQPYAVQLQFIGKQMHDEINRPGGLQEKVNALLLQIPPINKKLTALEDEFSYTLGEGARWVEKVVLELLFAIALTVEFTGLLLAISVSRSMQKGLGEIIDAARDFANGALGRRARVFSKDEIGVLAESFNQMSGKLEHNIADLEEAQQNFKTLNESLELKVAERTAQLEEVNRELESFSYSVSHDLQAPVRVAGGFANALVKDYGEKLDETGQYMLNTINASMANMSQLIKDLLRFSKTGKTQLSKERINMNEVVDAIVSEARTERPNSYFELVMGDLAPAFADPTLIKVVWENLVSNAVKYSRKREKPLIEIGSGKLNGEYYYFIRDNGAGFDMSLAQKLFTPFKRFHHSKDYEGTGIGLALVHRIVTKHGGKIWAETEVDKGATFYFTLSPKGTLSAGPAPSA